MLRVALLAVASTVGAAAAARPNLVFILADDLGYNELNFMNSSRGIVTPHLDALAGSGVVMRNYYVQPICSPTRSALITGRVPLHLGTQASVIYWDTPWAIDVGETFLPQNLRDAGYATAMFGKWHLGMFRESATPRHRGFEEHMGYYQGCGSEATHVASCCGAGPNVSSGDHDFVCGRGQGEDFRGYDWFKSKDGSDSEPDVTANRTRSAVMIGDAAVDYIGRAGKSKPFFLYLPFQNIHGPYTAEQRHRDLYPEERFTADEQTVLGYLSEMDEQVGRIVAALKAEAGLFENTIIIFSSDNGAPNEGDAVDHPEQVVPGLSPNWIRRNYPFRGHKALIWEGGVRVAGFVSSPLLPSEVRGTESSELYHVTDWLPTLVALAGGNTTRNRDLDGYDIWQSLSAAQPSPRKEVLYNVNPLCDGGQAGAPKAGIRVGKWKLLAWCYEIKGIQGSDRTGPVNAPAGNKEFADGPALFDLEADPRETTNLAAAQPAKVAELLGRLQTWAESSVEPMQWEPPFQGESYFCKDCPKHPAGTGVDVPWTPWISDDDNKPLDVSREATAFADHLTV